MSSEIPLRSVSQYLPGKSTLVQVMDGVVRQQAITFAKFDPELCHHMVSQSQNELSTKGIKPYAIRNISFKIILITFPYASSNTETLAHQ